MTETADSQGAVRKIDLEFPDMVITDNEIDNFLRTPIDSRLGNRNSRPTPKITSPNLKSPVHRLRTTMRFNMHTVNFDWDSQIHRLSTKFSNKKKSQLAHPTKTKIRGLPDIAKREIILENQKLGRFEDSYQEEDFPEEEEAPVFPLRKNEIPNIRVDPGILRPPKRKTRYD